MTSNALQARPQTNTLNAAAQPEQVVKLGLMGLVGLRLALVLVFLLNWIPLDLRNGWLLEHGGDQQAFFQLAISIINGDPQPAVVALGQALVMAPWIAWLRPEQFSDIIVPLVIINGFILGGFSVWVMGQTVWQITQEKWASLMTAGLWAMLPLLMYVVFFWHPEWVILRSVSVPTFGWINGLSDGPSLLFSMVAVWFLALAFRAGTQAPWWQMVGIGAALSLTIVFRVHYAPMVLVILIYVWVTHGWRNLLIVCATGLIVYLPQAIYNQMVFGLPITAGYFSWGDIENYGGTFNRPISDMIASIPFSRADFMQNIFGMFSSRPWILPPLLLGGIAYLSFVIQLWRKQGWQPVVFLVVAPLAYLAMMSFSTPFRADPLRFSMPILPYLMIVSIYGAGEGINQLRQHTLPSPATAYQPTQPESDAI
ncbi:MAG: hypothetical protein GYB68_14440 [Chloroflexi bacterium]|nr:hypothetical protein [Chloroflexota bacterium]